MSGSFDPFDEFDDSYEPDPPPSDPFLRKRHEQAEELLELLINPRFRETLQEFRLEDPTRLIRRNARRMRERAHLLDPSRLMMGTLVRIVMHREDFDGTMARPAWIDDRIDETIADLLIQDQEDERAGLPVKEPLQARYAQLITKLQIDPPKARRSCILVNDLPDAQRRVFFEIVFMLESTRNLVDAGFGKKAEIRDRFRSAVRTLELGDIGFDANNLHEGTGQPFDLMGGYDV